MFAELVNQRSAGGTRILAAAAIALLVALRALTAGASASTAVERLLSSARELHVAGKLEEARALYERALSAAHFSWPARM